MAAWREQFAQLSEQRYGALVGYASLLTGDGDAARDLVHDALLKVFGRARHFPSIGHAEAYVKRAIASLFLDQRRRASSRNRAYAAAIERDETPDSQAHVADHDEVAAALASLSPRERACAVLRFYDDLPIAEIAHALGISTGAAKRYLADGRRKLAEQLGEIEEPTGATAPVTAGRKS